MMQQWFVTAEAVGKNTTIGNILFVSISFLLLVLCVKKFAWGNITKILDERSERISNDLDSAEQSRIQAEELQIQREDELKRARQDSIQIINDAKDTASKSGQQIINTAKQDAVELQQKAKREIAADKEKAYREVKNDIAAMSLEIATKIMNKELDEKTHQALIDSCIEGLNHHEA